MKAVLALIAAAVADALALVWAAAVLPERVPAHFGISGQVDRMSSRTELIVVLGAILVLLLTTFLGSILLVRRLAIGSINVPHKAYWTHPERVGRMRDMMTTDMAIIGVPSILLLGTIPFAIKGSLRFDPPTLPGWWWVVMVLLLGAILGWIVAMLVWRYRPPADDPGSG